MTADEARRLLIWIGHRKLGKSAKDVYELPLANPVQGRNSIRLRDTEFISLNRRTADRKGFASDRRGKA